MPYNMHNRNLLSLMHHSKRELMFLLDLSRDLKRAKYSGTETQHYAVRLTNARLLDIDFEQRTMTIGDVSITANAIGGAATWQRDEGLSIRAALQLPWRWGACSI